MTRSRRALFTAVLAVAVLATACTSTQEGTATPGAVSPVATSVRLPVAPSVSRPLSVTTLRDNACTLLDTARLRAMGFGSTTTALPEKDIFGIGCGWTDDTIGLTGAQIGVDLQIKLTGEIGRAHV